MVLSEEMAVEWAFEFPMDPVQTIVVGVVEVDIVLMEAEVPLASLLVIASLILVHERLLMPWRESRPLREGLGEWMPFFQLGEQGHAFAMGIPALVDRTVLGIEGMLRRW
jgi:hypothetical protein